MCESLSGIIQKLITISAETFPGTMPGTALQPDHRLDSLMLSDEAMIRQACPLFCPQSRRDILIPTLLDIDLFRNLSRRLR